MTRLSRLLYGVPSRRDPVVLPIVILGLLAALVVAGSLSASGVQAGDAGSPVAQAQAAPESPYRPIPVATEGPDGSPAAVDVSPVGDPASDCLPRVVHGDSWLDACWQAWRDMREEDPEHDYYDMAFYATIHGAGAGIKWATLAGSVSGDGVDIHDWSEVVEGLPDGACRRVTMSARGHLSGVQWQITACEHVEAGEVPTQVDGRSGYMSWTCGGCLVGIRGDREVALLSEVATTGHEPPIWHLSADFGG
jgi:hypothetical protein